ncbi:hypothetical protein B0T10DRAFT_460758 [Thelonectria olida]|uniref:Uncharacterized protein n=1 Tax=Thelonectria olida TaxID=1576542 RepID=A0A9P8W264_9HYPO|nr:hypothetical protein B0T10DRAFT_460758 [Thelonectria olida]
MSEVGGGDKCDSGEKGNGSAVFQDAAKANGGKIRRIADSVKLYIAKDEGSWHTLLDAGLPPSCGPYIGLEGLLVDGKIGISASNRSNFKGRFGSRLVRKTDSERVAHTYQDDITKEGMENYDAEIHIVVVSLQVSWLSGLAFFNPP